MEAPYILPLGESRQASLALCGGKGYRLSTLAGWGFQVPPGFCLTSAAFQFFLEENGINPAPPENFFETPEVVIAAFAETIQSQILQKPFPPELENIVAEALEKFWKTLPPGTECAVRSSATQEDSETASFAGIQETFLHQKNPKQALSALRHCWASAFSPRAFSYRIHKGFLDPITMAVVVQKQVAAEKSGVFFTIHPVTGSKKICVVNATFGLGELVVSGKVTPDHYELDRYLNALLKFVPGVFPPDITRRGKRVLDDKELDALFDLALEVEHRYGDQPQDIEWCMAEGKIFLLQTRPVTTHGGSSLPGGGGNGGTILRAEAWKRANRQRPGPAETFWTRTFADEYWADPVTPLFFSTFGPLVDEELMQGAFRILGLPRLAEYPPLRLHANRIYFNASLLAEFLKSLPPGLRKERVEAYLPGELHARALKGGSSWFGFLKTRRRLRKNSRDAAIDRCAAAFEAWVVHLERKLEEFHAKARKEGDEEALLEGFSSLQTLTREHLRIVRWGLMSHGQNTFYLAGRLLERWFEKKEALAGLQAGLPGILTDAANISLWRLERLLRSFPEEHNAFLKTEPVHLPALLSQWGEVHPVNRAFLSFLKEYGHRRPYRDFFSVPWKDDPGPLLSLLQSSLKRPCSLPRPETSSEWERNRERLFAEVMAGVKGPFKSLKRKIFQMVLGYAQVYLRMRENQRHYLDLLFMEQRILLLSLGKLWVQKDWLAGVDGLFFLTWEEILQAKAQGGLSPGQRKILEDRRKEYESPAFGEAPLFLKGDSLWRGSVTQGESTAASRQGIGASPGCISGKARVVRTLGDAHLLQAGEILVAPFTDPAWTPLFLVASGLITEAGGMLSHGAVLAREYALPAVIGIQQATKWLEGSPTIVMDGTTGTVAIR